jgi:hypothetical protein
VISNNTIVDCDEGITVERVRKPTRWGLERYEREDVYAAVENNIVTSYTIHGIRIGQEDQSDESTAAAWSPFVNDLEDGELGNSLVPVCYNMVWSEDDPTSATAFVGDSWYQQRYESPIFEGNRYGEVFEEPELDEYLVPGPHSNVLESGHPYRLDLYGLSDCRFLWARRGVGALKCEQQNAYESEIDLCEAQP